MRQSNTDPVAELEVLIRSRYGIIHVDTLEDERVAELLRLVSDRITTPFFTWTRSHGICRDGHSNGIYDTTDPVKAHATAIISDTAGIYHFVGLGSAIQNDAVIDRLKEAAENLGARRGAIILSGDGISASPSLARLIARVELPRPDVEHFRELLRQVHRDVSRKAQVGVELSPEDESRLLSNLKGLSLLEATRVLTRAMVDDNRLTVEDVEAVLRAKKQIVESEGVLEYYPAETVMADVADLAGLKAWIAKRRMFITQPEKAQGFGLSFPKGILLIGVPGCGKSLCARAVAGDWGLPLVRLDTAALYNKFVGETERNFKRAMDTAERLSPCVLFIDELEKAFAAGGTEDGGLSHRVLGAFLSWLQDRRGDVFTVATANDIERLPPELLRKGRFDEVFFVDLPNEEARREILGIHMRRRKQDIDTVDVHAIVTATSGFSGAEIEQVVVSALYTAFSAGGDGVTTELLLHEACVTRPLSVTMAEKVAALRSWAKDRTVAAN
jgi:SpoVK/Ycf46/Vps4 family AAA+-type ATPase